MASRISDCCSNSLRVLKTKKQTAGGSDGGEGGEISYKEAVDSILGQNGWAGLFGRGLQTRLLTNAIKCVMASILWRYFQQTGNGL